MHEVMELHELIATIETAKYFSRRREKKNFDRM